MAAVKWVMANLLRSDQITFNDYWNATYGKTDWDALHYLSGEYDKLRKTLDQDSINPLGSLASMQRIGFKRIFSLNYSVGAHSDLYDLIATRISPDHELELIQGIAEFLPRGIRPKHGEILVDVPLKRRLHNLREQGTGIVEAQAERSVRPKLWVCCRGQLTKENQTWIELHQYSPLAKRLGAIEDLSARKIRIFFASSLLGRLDIKDKLKIESQIFEHLVEVTRKWC